ncbi:CPBP family intramembrane glutamic endopeptidase [Lysobacter korlensis]|uniref:CPBP family intramembrane glutamic endopeptidase n=1 Tax=Lysobacter korlensis TaxID=553636 RepID=A0ABV6RMD0_9GAMM
MTTTTSSPVHSTPPTPGGRHPATRRQLVAFWAVLAGLVLPSVAVAVAHGVHLEHLDKAPLPAQLALYGQALAPALATLAAWAVGRRAPDWGFRRVGWGAIGTAWLLPVLGLGLAYGTAWLTGLAGFRPAALADSSGMPFLVVLLLGLIPGLVPYLLLALTEQLGWSSLLTARLGESRGADSTAVLVGLSWAAFHVPMMLFVNGAVPAGLPVPWAVAMFVLQCVVLAFPMVWLRLRTRSIWPVLVMHATLNAVLYWIAEPATDPAGTAGWFVGEGGVLTAAGLLVAVVATARLWRRS